MWPRLVGCSGWLGLQVRATMPNSFSLLCVPLVSSPSPLPPLSTLNLFKPAVSRFCYWISTLKQPFPVFFYFPFEDFAGHWVRSVLGPYGLILIFFSMCCLSLATTREMCQCISWKDRSVSSWKYQWNIRPLVSLVFITYLNSIENAIFKDGLFIRILPPSWSCVFKKNMLPWPFG